MQTSGDRTHLCLSSCCALVLHAILIRMLEQRMLRIRSILRDRCMFRLHVHAWKPCTCSYACRRCSRRSSKYLAHAPSNACLRSLWEIHDIINASSPGGAVLNLYKPHTSLLKRRHLCPPMVGYDRSIHRCRLCGPCVPRLYRRRNGMEDLLTRRQCMHPWMHSDRRRGETLSIFLARRCSSCDASSYTKASCFQEA